MILHVVEVVNLSWLVRPPNHQEWTFVSLGWSCPSLTILENALWTVPSIRCDEGVELVQRFVIVFVELVSRWKIYGCLDRFCWKFILWLSRKSPCFSIKVIRLTILLKDKVLTHTTVTIDIVLFAVNPLDSSRCISAGFTSFCQGTTTTCTSFCICRIRCCCTVCSGCCSIVSCICSCSTRISCSWLHICAWCCLTRVGVNCCCVCGRCCCSICDSCCRASGVCDRYVDTSSIGICRDSWCYRSCCIISCGRCFLKQILTAITRLIRRILLIGLNLLIRQQGSTSNSNHWKCCYPNCHPILLHFMHFKAYFLFHIIYLFPLYYFYHKLFDKGIQLHNYNVSLMYSPWFSKKSGSNEW